MAVPVPAGGGRALSLLDAFRITLRAIFANRLRSALTSLVVVIGVSSVIALVAVGQGTQQGVTDRIRGLGTGLIFIESSAAATTSQTGGFPGLVQSTLVQGDATAIAADAIPGVVAVSARVAIDTQLVAGANNVGAEVVATSSEYGAVRNLPIRSGSFITPLHDEDGTMVAVLGARAAETLYPGVDPRRTAGAPLFRGRAPHARLRGNGRPRGAGRLRRGQRPGLRPAEEHREPSALPVHADGRPACHPDRCAGGGWRRRGSRQGGDQRVAAVSPRDARAGLRDPEPG